MSKLYSFRGDKRGYVIEIDGGHVGVNDLPPQRVCDLLEEMEDVEESGMLAFEAAVTMAKELIECEEKLEEYKARLAHCQAYDETAWAAQEGGADIAWDALDDDDKQYWLEKVNAST